MWLSSKTAVMLTSNISRSRSNGVSMKEPYDPRPALLIRRSMGDDFIFDISFDRPLAVDRSAAIISTVRHSFESCPDSSASFCLLRPVKIKLVDVGNSLAKLSPIPLVAPVIRAQEYWIFDPASSDIMLIHSPNVK